MEGEKVSQSVRWKKIFRGTKTKNRKWNKVWEENGMEKKLIKLQERFTHLSTCRWIKTCVVCMGFAFMHMHACLYLLHECQQHGMYSTIHKGHAKSARISSTNVCYASVHINIENVCRYENYNVKTKIVSSWSSTYRM